MTTGQQEETAENARLAPLYNILEAQRNMLLAHDVLVGKANIAEAAFDVLAGEVRKLKAQVYEQQAGLLTLGNRLATLEDRILGPTEGQSNDFTVPEGGGSREDSSLLAPDSTHELDDHRYCGICYDAGYEAGVQAQREAPGR